MGSYIHMYSRDRYYIFAILLKNSQFTFYCFEYTSFTITPHCYTHSLCAMLSCPLLAGQPLYYPIDYPAVMYSGCASGNSLNALPDFALVIEGVHR